MTSPTFVPGRERAGIEYSVSKHGKKGSREQDHLCLKLFPSLVATNHTCTEYLKCSESSSDVL